MNKKILDEAWKHYEHFMDQYPGGKISSVMREMCKQMFYFGAGFAVMNHKSRALNMVSELIEHFNKNTDVNNFFRENVKDDPIH